MKTFSDNELKNLIINILAFDGKNEGMTEEQISEAIAHCEAAVVFGKAVQMAASGQGFTVGMKEGKLAVRKMAARDAG